MKTPLLLAAALLLAPIGASLARAGTPKPVLEVPAPLPHVRALVASADDKEPEPKSTPPTANAATKTMLAKIGWKAIDNDARVRLTGADKGYIPGNYFEEASIEWKKGDLSFKSGNAI